MLGYTFTLAIETIKSQEFRTEILNMILKVYESKPAKQAGAGGGHDYYKIAKCQFHLNLPESTTVLLENLTSDNQSDPNDTLVAYQIAFDIVEKESQTYTTKV